jgi:NOL1/NOP2/fmu family ribosome biogenesis protein
MFGKHAKKNFIELSKEDAVRFIRGEDMDTKPEGVEDGYVILKYEGVPLGCGLLKEGHIKNMVPKAKRLEVEFI